MAPPTVIPLDVLKNTFRDGIFTNTFPFTVNSDTEVDVGVIHKEDFKKVLFQLKNLGVNGFDFVFYGAAVDDTSHGTDVPFLPPPDFANGDYFPLPVGTGTINGGDNDARIITDNWTWVLLRVKRTSAGLDTTISLDVRGE